MNKPMSCQFFKDHLNDYLDSEMDMETRHRMDRHAQACPECGERLEVMTRLLTMCAELDEGITMPLEGQAAWRKAVREEAAKQKPRRGRGFIRALGTVAAAAVLITAGTFAYRISGSLPLAQPNAAPYAGNGMEADGGFYYGEMADNQNAAGARMLSVEADGAYDSAEIAGAKATPTVVSDGAGGAQPESSAQSRSVVVLRSAQRELESAAFEKSLQSVQDLVSEYEGYFERSEVSGQPITAGTQYGRIADLTVRVPVAQLDDFLSSLDAAGKVTRKRESAEDISSRYYDSKTRLDSAKTQMERLNQLVTTAANLEDMLLLQSKIDETQQTIDSLEGDMRAWDSRASYSTVDVLLTEVAARDQVMPQATTLQERMKAAFYDSVNWLNGFWQDATVVLAMAAPLLVIILPVVVLILIIVASIRRHRRKKNRG